MFPGDSSDQTTVRYLLGKLSQADREDFEDRYFSDDALLEQVQATEEELIDAYVRGRLDPADRAAFERRFLDSPEVLQRVEFARALAALPAAESRARGSLLSRWFSPAIGMRLALAGAMAATIAAVILMTSVDRHRPQRAVVTPGKESKGTGQTIAPVLAFVLAPGVRSAGSGNRLSIQPGSYQIRMSLTLTADADFPNYAAVLSKADGKEVWRGDKLKREGAGVTIVLPSTLLAAGDYAVKLTGVDGATTEAVAGYSFTVLTPK